MRVLAISTFLTGALATGCTVPDKFFSDAGGGDDDQIDARVDEIDGGVDTTAPETTITVAPAEFSSEGSASFEFSADEDATFVCSIDGEAPAPCTSPYAQALSNGPHTFSVAAIDLAGNQDETPAEHAWEIDTDPPDTTITAAPPAVDNSTSVAVEFSSDESNVSFECSLDQATFTACTSPSAHEGLADGGHDFRVRAIDRAGNVDGSPASHAWTVDSSTPDTTIDTGPTGAVAASSATFTFSSPNAGAGATFECRLVPAAFAACTSPRALTGLAEGSHTFEVRVRNAALTYDPTPASRTWTVDLTPPTTTITASPSGAVASTSANISFTSNEAGTFQCSVDGGAYAACASPASLTGLAQGAHTFSVRAIDAAGNQDASPATASWTVDTVPPNTTIVAGPATMATSTVATFDLASSEAGTFQCRVDGAAYATCSDPNTRTVTEGPHTYDAVAVDAAGNVDPTPATWAWTVDSTAPVVTFVSPTPAQSSTTGPYNTFAWTVSRSATTTCRINGGTAFACTSPYTTHIKAGTSTTFTVTATDTFGNVGNATRTWTIACAAPTADANTFGLLHMDETSGQTMTNVGTVMGNAFLGNSTSTESIDPTRTPSGRFAGGITFNASEADTSLWNIGAATAFRTRDHSIELWIRPTGPGTADSSVFTSADGRVRLTLEASGGSYFPAYAITDDAGATVVLQTTASISTGSWHLLAATYTGTTMTLWVDGVASTASSGAVSPTSQFTFGGLRLGWSAISYAGDMDEVFLSTAALDASTMLSRYCPAP